MSERVAALRREVTAATDAPDRGPLFVTMDQVTSAAPVYLAGGMVRKSGVHLWWGPPNWYKTYSCILLALEMTQRAAGEPLFGVAGLEILRPWRRVLWLGDEESAEEWKWRAENLARGHGLRPPEAEILFADASGGSCMLTTDNLPELLDAAGEGVDAVFLDPLPNLLPASTHGDGDPNPAALTRVCRPLRRLAKTRGVAVFLLTHPNASGQRERGATAYRGSADVVVEVKLEAGILTLLDVKNRDRSRGQVSFLPTWTATEHELTLRLAPTETPAGTILGGLTPCARAMYSAATTGAGRVSYAELLRTPFPAKDKSDVSVRTKQRAWRELCEAGLVTDAGGVVRLLDPHDTATEDGNGATT